MKKLLTKFCLLTGMIGLLGTGSAVAADYYLIGDEPAGGWSMPPTSSNLKFTAQSDGKYVLELPAGLSNGKNYKVGTGGSNSWDMVFGGRDGANSIAIGSTTNLWRADNLPALEYKSTSGTPVKLTFWEENTQWGMAGYLKLESYTPEVPVTYSYGLHTNCLGDPSWNTYKMTQQSNGSWTLAEQHYDEGQFGIKKINDLTGQQAAWINADKNADVTLDQAMKCKEDGINFNLLAGTYAMMFDPSTMTLTVTGKTDEPEPDPITYSIYLNNTAGWDEVWLYTFEPEVLGAFPGTKLDKNESGLYYWDYTTRIEPSFGGIIFSDGTKNDTYKTQDLDYEVGKTYTNGDAVQKEIWVNLNGSFFDGNNGVLADEDGIATFTEQAIGANAVYIKVYDGNDKYYYSETPVPLRTWTTLVPGKEDSGTKIEGQVAGNVYDVKFNVNNNQIYFELVSQSEPSIPEVFYFRSELNGWGEGQVMTRQERTTDKNEYVYVIEFDNLKNRLSFKISENPNDWKGLEFGAGDYGNFSNAGTTNEAFVNGGNFTTSSDFVKATLTFYYNPAENAQHWLRLDAETVLEDIDIDLVVEDSEDSKVEGNNITIITKKDSAVVNVKADKEAEVYYKDVRNIEEPTTYAAGDDLKAEGYELAQNNSDGTHSIKLSKSATGTLTIKYVLNGNTSTEKTYNYSVEVNTGVAGIEAENGEAVYFNLQGVKVANPQNGVFVKVANGKAVKVVVND